MTEKPADVCSDCWELPPCHWHGCALRKPDSPCRCSGCDAKKLDALSDEEHAALIPNPPLSDDPKPSTPLDVREPYEAPAILEDSALEAQGDHAIILPSSLPMDERIAFTDPFGKRLSGAVTEAKYLGVYGLGARVMVDLVAERVGSFSITGESRTLYDFHAAHLAITLLEESP